MEDKDKNLLQISEEMNSIKSKINSLVQDQDSIKNLSEDNKNKINVLNENLDNIDKENDNLIEKLRNLDGSHDIDLDLSNYVTLDTLKTELRKYQKLSIDYIDRLAEGGWDSDIKGNLENLNGRVSANEESISSTMSKVNKYDSTIQYLSTKVEQTAESIKSIATDYTLNEINQSITKLESFREQTARVLQDTVTRADIDTMNNKVTEFESQVSQFADLIEQTVSKSEIDGITIGGKNLLENSLAIKGNWLLYPESLSSTKENALTFGQDNNGKSYFTINTDGIEGEVGTISYNSFPLKYNETYTISFDFRSDTFNRLDHCYFIDPSGNYTTPIAEKYLDIDEEWHRYSFVYKQTLTGRNSTKLLIGVDTDLNQLNGTFDISSVKVERGSVSSDWTPAPEDFDNMLENYNKDINNKIDNIEENAIGLGDTVTEAFKDGIISNAEKIAIEKQKNIIDKDKKEIDQIFNSLYANKMMTNSVKTELKNNYDLFNEKYNILLQDITNTISDGIATKEEVAQFNTNFLRYNEAQSNIKSSIQKAVDNISNGYAVDEASKITVGGMNLVSYENILAIGSATLNKNTYKENGEMNVALTANGQGIKFKLDKVRNRREHVLGFNLEKKTGTLTNVDINIPNASVTSCSVNGNKIGSDSRSITFNDTSSLTFIEVVFIPNDSFTTNTPTEIVINRNGTFPLSVDVEGLKVEEGNKATAWQPSIKDSNARITNMESRISQNEKNIDLSVTKETYNADKSKMEKMGSALSILADGISMSSSSNDKLSSFDIDPNSIKLKSKMVDINDGDVIISNGKATIKEASITNLMSKNIVVQTMLDAMGEVKGGITIKRPDGGYLVYNGMPRFTTAYVRSEPGVQDLMSNGTPRFKNVGNAFMFSDKTTGKYFRRAMTMYGQHETRWLHIGIWYATPQCGIDIKVDSFNDQNGVFFDKTVSIPKDTSTSVTKTKHKEIIVDMGIPAQSIASIAIRARVKPGQKGNAWILNSYVYGRN
ncbi:putative tail fiber [Staphylococcus phage vB_StaM_PB50]|nr:putative tail fiber [Staphylococcus phage vB_StaM_PB50]